MKSLKVIFALGIFFTALIAAPSAEAQVTSMKSQYNLTVDTVTNTGTKWLKTLSLNGYSKVVAVQFIAEEISGTTGGTAQLQGSLDGSYWYNIGSAYTLTDVASQSTVFTITDFPHVYLRVFVTGTGTMSDKIYAKFIRRS